MDRKSIPKLEVMVELFILSSNNEDNNLFSDNIDDDPDFTAHALYDASV